MFFSIQVFVISLIFIEYNNSESGVWSWGILDQPLSEGPVRFGPMRSLRFYSVAPSFRFSHWLDQSPVWRVSRPHLPLLWGHVWPDDGGVLQTGSLCSCQSNRRCWSVRFRFITHSSAAVNPTYWLSLRSSLPLSLNDSLFIFPLSVFLFEEQLFNPTGSSVRREGLIQRRRHGWAEQFSAAASSASRWKQSLTWSAGAAAGPRLILQRKSSQGWRRCSLLTFTPQSERDWFKQVAVMEMCTSHQNLQLLVVLWSWTWWCDH